MKRIVLVVPALAAGVLLVGCSSSAPTDTQAAQQNAAQTKQMMGAKAVSSAAPTVVDAPPGVATGDHRGGLAGGTIPGMTKK